MDRDVKYGRADASSHAASEGPGRLPGKPSGSEARPMSPPEPGTLVRILTSDDDGDGFPARVIEVDQERVLLRLPRGFPSQGHVFHAGGQVQLLIGKRDSALLYQAAVLSRPDDGIMAIMLSGHPLRLQRRDYFRIVVRLPIAVTLSREENAEEPGADKAGSVLDEGPEGTGMAPGHAAASAPGIEARDAAGVTEPFPGVPEIRIFRLADLSGGGCLCLDPDNLLRRDRLYPATLDLHDGEPLLQVRVEVVRRGVSFGYPSAGLRFVAIAEKYRERIMRTLFREYRNRASGGRL